MASVSSDETDLYRQVDDYPWESDEEFQSGLEAILGSHPSQEQAESLTLQAKCFYYARKSNVSIDFEGYKAHRAQQQTDVNGAEPSSTAPQGPSDIVDVPPSTTTSDAPQVSSSVPGSEPPAPYPTSFSQIVELITNGEPIPGVKEVPDTLLSGQESQPSTAKRKKPWEKEDAEHAANIETKTAGGSSSMSSAPG